MTNDEKFQEFLKNEYSIIAQAHFDVSGRVTTFFQYLLLIYSAVFIFLSADVIASTGLAPIKGWVYVAISALGIIIMLYISHLRYEALLYARHINGIRKRFYNDLKQQYSTIQQTMLLPNQITKPRYLDKSQFIFIIVAISLINSIFLFAAAYTFNWTNLIRFSAPLVLLAVQIVLYFYFSYISELGYNLYKPIIGIDIDGVIADHRIQFCSIFRKLNPGFEIDPEKITRIPVYKSNIMVTEEKEREVFKIKEYWTDMPYIGEAKKEITRIKDKFGLKVYIFTWRHWNVNGEKLEKITKDWLIKGFGNKFFNRIYFEKGNLYSPVKTRKYKQNRFSYSVKHDIMFFIEDNVDNAIRLSNIVKFVFLFDQPYNREYDLPYNVIRIKEWSELEELIAKLI